MSSTTNTSVDLSTRNTLSEQLENINLTQENAVAILDGLVSALSGNLETVDIEIAAQDGTTSTVTISSITKMASDISRLSTTITEMSNLNSDSAATIVDESGEYKRIFISSFNNTIAGDASGITKSDTVQINYDSMIRNLMFPSTNIQFELPNDFLLVDEVLVKTFRFSDSSTFTNVYNGITYGETLLLSTQGSILGTWYSDIITTDKREQRYYGSFDVLSIQSYNTDGSMNVLLSSTNYSDINSITDTRELYTGDELVTKSGNAKYTIQTVDHYTNIIKILQTYGVAELVPGIGVLQYHYSITDETRCINVPIVSYEKSIVFFQPVNPMNGVTGIISTGYVIDTSTLVVYESNVSLPFDTYYTNAVTNVGTYLEEMLSDSLIPFSKGVTPTTPVLSEDDFTVVQINKHLSDNSTISDVSSLADEKEKLFSDISNLTTQISTVNARINTGRYRSSTDRTADETKLTSLMAQKSQTTALYSSIVEDISSKSSDNDLVNYTPKFRIRGFFPTETYVSSTDTRDQYIIKYKIEYRYCSTSSDTSEATTMSYTSSDGTEMHGVFSSWTEQVSPVLQKTKSVDGTVSWQTINTENGDEININQIDIPIKPGESVELRVKSLSEAGYPTTYTESAWSNIVRVEFPAALQNFTSVSTMIDKNIEDKQKLEVEQMFDEVGLTDHLMSSYKENDNYFAHTAYTISSGYKSTEQVSISLFDYLTTLTTQIATLQAQISRSTLEPTIEIIDSDSNAYTVSNYSTMQIYAGTYDEDLTSLDSSTYGDIVEKILYLKISNNNTTSLDLLSPCPGNLSENVTDASYYYPTVQLTTVAIDDPMVQYNGQIVYLRYKNIADQTSGSELYYINDGDSILTTTSVIPTDDIDSSALDTDKNVMYRTSDGTFTTCKLLSSALNEFVALSTDHPLVQAYISSASETNISNLNTEFDRIEKNNVYYKTIDVQNAYSPNRNTSYVSNDKYVVGQNSCGARLYMKINSLQNIQVSGSSSTSSRILQTGDSNVILIPIIYQYRMTDILGNVDGKTNNTGTNIEYSKKIGFDMYVGTTEYKFDLEVISRYTSNSTTDISTTRVDEISYNISTSDDVTPSIQ